MEEHLPVGWISSTLQEVAEWGSGGTPSRNNSMYFSGNIPWIKTGELGSKYIREAEEHITEEAIQNSSAKVFPRGSIGIAMYGATIGKLSIWGIDASTNQACAVAQTCSEVLYNEYLYYFLASEKRDIIAAGKGGAQPNISQSILKGWMIPLPPLNEQKRIVTKIEELFSELDKGIESLKTAREQLKVYRQAVLKHAFEGKLTAKWREENKDNLGTSEQLLEFIEQERDSGYQQLLNEWNVAVKANKKLAKPRAPQSMATLTLRELQSLPSLPAGWIWLRYGDLCSIVRNGISQKPEGNEGTKILRISAVRPMEFITDDIRYIDNSNGQYDEYFLCKGDLVFTRYNGSRSFVGVCAEYKADGTHLFPDKLIQTRITIPSIINSYLEKAINCGAPREFLERLIRTTAGQSGISGADIKAMPIPICSKAEQTIINNYLDEKLLHVSQMMDEIEIDLQKSEALRQSILKKAFSGKLVPQDPNDEPASVLLERIRAEKEDQSGKKSSNRNGRGQNKVALLPELVHVADDADERSSIDLESLSPSSLTATQLRFDHIG